MNKLYIMIGNIGSGKSIWVKKNKHLGLIISRDSLRYMIGAGAYIFNPELEPYIFKSEKAILEVFMKSGKDIIIDEVGVSKQMRKEYIKLAKKYNYKCIAVCMPKYSKKICVSRRMKSSHGNQNKKIWEIVWDRFDYRYEPPTLKEGFNIIRKV